MEIGQRVRVCVLKFGTKFIGRVGVLKGIDTRAKLSHQVLLDGDNSETDFFASELEVVNAEAKEYYTKAEIERAYSLFERQNEFLDFYDFLINGGW